MTESRFEGVRASRRHFAAAAAVFLLLLAPSGAAADDDGGNERNEGRDTQSRHEMRDLQHIPLTLGGGIREDIHNIVVIQARFITIKRTRFGIDSKNLDRVDVSEVPLVGSLFGHPLRAEDLNDDNRVGAVYSTGNGALAAFINDDVPVGDLSVVNGKYRYTPTGASEAAQASQLDLGNLGKLSSVQQAVTGQASAETTIVLRGLTTTSVPAVEEKIPVLADVPQLRQFFRGSVHDLDDELIFFIQPSIIAGDGAE
jgi:hypothetical protein